MLHHQVTSYIQYNNTDGMPWKSHYFYKIKNIKTNKPVGFNSPITRSYLWNQTDEHTCLVQRNTEIERIVCMCLNIHCRRRFFNADIRFLFMRHWILSFFRWSLIFAKTLFNRNRRRKIGEENIFIQNIQIFFIQKILLLYYDFQC